MRRTRAACRHRRNSGTALGNDRIQKFTADGSFRSMWGGRGSSPGEFHDPKGIAVDSNGDSYVADTGNDRVEKFSPPPD